MSRPGFNFSYQENFLSLAEQLIMIAECRKRFPDPLPRHKRTKKIYGVKDMTYTVVYRGTVVTYPVEDWDTFPLLKAISMRVDKKRTCVVVQYYPDGLGIPAHRDKEMKHGTAITGISLGWERWLEITRCDCENFRQRLVSGSRYDINPPTNDLYAHAIPSEENAGERWSLTIREA